MTRIAGGALLALLIVTPLAAAQGTQNQEPPANLPSELAQLSLEELADVKIDSVYGASLFLQKVTEAPSSVTIITADHIQKYGHRTLADVLRTVRGFYVTNDRNYSFLGVRGFSRPGDYNARVLLLVDGHRLNDNIFGSALIGTEFPLDIDLIERIEIIRGPSSSLYGTSAFFGVINVITKNGGSINGFDLSGGAASFESRKGRVTFGQTFRNAELLLSASAYDSSGERRLFFEEFDAPDTNHGFAENADGDESGQLFGKLRVGNLTFQGLFGSRDKTVPTASFGTVFNDPRSRTVENQGFLDLRYRTPIFSGWDLDSRLHYDGYGYDGDYVFEHSVDDITDTVVNKDFARGNWWGADVTATKRFAQRHTLALGSEYRDNVRQDQFNYDLASSFYHLDDRRSSTSWAVYAQDEIALHRKLRFNVGLRHDYYDTFGETTNPRAAVIYNPADTTTVKVLYGAAFRAPNAYELFWQQSGIGKANPALQPETNRTSELVLERYLGRHLRVTGTGFYYTVKGLITQQTDAVDSLLVYKNVETIKAHGLELELDGNWPSGLEGRVSYAYQDSRNQTTRMPLTNSPGHVAHFNLITPLAGRNVFAGVGVRYISERRTIAGDTVAPAFVPNITFSSRRLGKGIELAAGVYNLFDSKYRDPGSEEHRQDSIVQVGRTVRVKLTYKFPSVR